MRWRAFGVSGSVVLATFVASAQQGSSGSSENNGGSSASIEPPPPPPSEIVVTRPATPPTAPAPAPPSTSATTKRGPLVGRFNIHGGEYNPAPAKHAAPVVAGPIADRAGFDMGTEGSKVFVEFSNGQPKGPTIARAKNGVITVTFTGAWITKRNNENPLITTHFNTPVAEARLTVPAGGSVSLVITLRKDNANVDISTGWLDNTALKTFAVVFAKGNYHTEADSERTPHHRSKATSDNEAPAASSSVQKGTSDSETGPRE